MARRSASLAAQAYISSIVLGGWRTSKRPSALAGPWLGSAAGRDSSPGWVFNLRANPQASVEIGVDRPKPVVAEELLREERDRIYDIVVKRAPGFGEYEQRTDRVIPVFELVPKG